MKNKMKRVRILSFVLFVMFIFTGFTTSVVNAEVTKNLLSADRLYMSSTDQEDPIGPYGVKLLDEAQAQVNNNNYTKSEITPVWNICWLALTKFDVDYEVGGVLKESKLNLTGNYLTIFKNHVNNLARKYEEDVRNLSNGTVLVKVDVIFPEETVTSVSKYGETNIMIEYFDISSIIDKYAPFGKYDTIMSFAQFTDPVNPEYSMPTDLYGGLTYPIYTMVNGAGYGTIPVYRSPIDSSEPSLRERNDVMHEWQHQLEGFQGLAVSGKNYNFGIPNNHDAFRYVWDGEYTTPPGDENARAFYKAFFTGKVFDPSTQKYIGMYPKMWCVKPSLLPPAAVAGVALSKKNAYLEVGNAETLNCKVTPENATNDSVTWSSSNTAVATVSSSGKVTAIKEGVATITVTTVDGYKTAQCTVNVSSDHYNNFENGYSGWSPYVAWTNSAESTRSFTLGAGGRNDSQGLKISTTADADLLFKKTFTGLDPNETYVVEACVKGQNISSGSYYNIGPNICKYGTWEYAAATNAGTYDWQKISLEFKPDSDGTAVIGLRLGYWSNICKGTVYFDDIRMYKKLSYSFEDGYAGWTATVNWANTPESTRAFTLESSAGRYNSKCLSISTTEDADLLFKKTLKGLDPSETYIVEGYVKGQNITCSSGSYNKIGPSICKYGTWECAQATNSGTYDWQKVTFKFKPESDGTANIGLRLGYDSNTCKGKVYFDDIKIYKDLTYNFEDGYAGWNSEVQWTNMPDSTRKFSLESNAGINGTKCVSISSTEYADLMFRKKLSSLDPSKTYTFEAYVKGEDIVHSVGDSGSIGPNICKYDTWTFAKAANSGSYSWQKVSFSFTPEIDGTADLCLRLGFDSNICKGKVYFDNVKIY